jgi:hypothetical protein
VPRVVLLAEGLGHVTHADRDFFVHAAGNILAPARAGRGVLSRNAVEEFGEALARAPLASPRIDGKFRQRVKRVRDQGPRPIL